jgi:hypothetical protein
MGWFYFFVYRCDLPPHWVPAFVKGPEWKSDRDANRYTSDLVYYSGQTSTPFTVHSWRHSGRPGDQWQDLGWTPASCP